MGHKKISPVARAQKQLTRAVKPIKAVKKQLTKALGKTRKSGLKHGSKLKQGNARVHVRLRGKGSVR